MTFRSGQADAGRLRRDAGWVLAFYFATTRILIPWIFTAFYLKKPKAT